MKPRFEGYHFDGFDFVYVGKKTVDEIKLMTGLIIVNLEDGSAWARWPKSGWEKIRDAKTQESES